MEKKVSKKRLTKWDICVMLENLPGNTPWSAASTATITLFGYLSRSELVDKYNELVTRRGLSLSLIS